MQYHNPSPEELEEWQRTAAKRRAVLPTMLEMRGRNVLITCGSCQEVFSRALLPNRNDPVYVCPNCQNRNYIPVEW